MATTEEYPRDATGDVVAGDAIRFGEGVFGGSRRKPAHLGDRTIEGQLRRGEVAAHVYPGSDPQRRLRAARGWCGRQAQGARFTAVASPAPMPVATAAWHGE